MSGIYISSMVMPDRCYGCFVRNWGYSGDGMKCHITGSVTSWHDGCLKRMDNCPLIPIPDHGRILKVLKTERECVSRDCDRKCGECDLALERNEILGAYDAIISMLSAPAEKEGLI